MSGVAGMPLPDVFLAPCGTLAAYRRHLRRGDPVDESCRQAVVRDWEDRVAAGYTRPSRVARVHLAGRPSGAAWCWREDVIVTGDPGRVTCRNCLSGYRRLPWVRAAEARRAA